MALFSSPFLSLAGQKERLLNVGATLKAAYTGKGVTAKTGSKTLDVVLSAAASNPIATTLALATVVSPLKVLGHVKAGFSLLPAGGKVAAVIGAPVVAGAVISNPSLIGKAVKAPSELAELGADVGSFIKEPSLKKAKDVVLGSPVISGVIAGGALLVGGGALARTISGIAQTEALQDIAASSQQLTVSGLPAVTTPAVTTSSITPLASEVPVSPETQILPRPAGTPTSSSRRAGRRRSEQRVSQSVRVNVFNSNKASLYRRSYH